MDESPTIYTIHLLGFPGIDEVEAAAALAKAFSIDLDRATRLVERAPVKVKSRALRADAERYIGALLQIGADVRVDTGTTSKTFRAAERLAARRAREGRQESGLGPGLSGPRAARWPHASTGDSGADSGLTPAPETSEEPAAPAVTPSPYVLSPEDDDGLFAEATPTFRPGDLLLGKEE